MCVFEFAEDPEIKPVDVNPWTLSNFDDGLDHHKDDCTKICQTNYPIGHIDAYLTCCEVVCQREGSIGTVKNCKDNIPS